MAYVQPTATVFKIRYPEFKDVSDVLIDLVLEETFADVGETWLERDRARAQMLLAAHKLTLEGEPARSASGIGAAGTGQIKRDKVGDVETEFATNAMSANDRLGYSRTSYGQDFQTLMRKNFPATVAV
ncbi:hypothetical protein IWQ49_006376 [Labrenzia sp. EL_126]|nr:hypothetical protein [Labrenzia sp. EL_126]